MIKTVGWVPHKGIMYAMPLEEYAVHCEQTFLKYDFSKVVGKVISIIECKCKVLWHKIIVHEGLFTTLLLYYFFFF